MMGMGLEENVKNSSIVIAKLAIQQFDALLKTGKPKENEWTVLSCIVKQQNYNFKVVSLGTGSKCIGKNKMCPKGTVLNDSHAEIMCRRAFLRYLYTNMNKDSLIFSFDEEKFKFSLKPNVKFHFFTTHVPCGDAAIFPKESDEDVGYILPSAEPTEDIPAKKRKLDEEDINRTGAKCLKNDTKQDLKGDGTAYHVVGVVRTKPGRGDPTASVSCSDKMSKWCHLGIQGSLLMMLLDNPIYLSTFIILNETPFCRNALNRALYDRLENVQLLPPYYRNLLDVQTVNLEFTHSKKGDRQPCSSSIVWFEAYKERYFEVGVNGRKQGITKKHLSSEKGRLKICKLELFKLFIDKLKEFNIPVAAEVDLEKMAYRSAKKLSKNYQENWTILKKQFGVWSNKDPTLLDFVVG